MGELAAVLTSIAWTFSSLFFTQGGKEIGSVALNRIRIGMALILFIVTHLILLGSPFPAWQGNEFRWLWLSLSGIIGLVIGDGFLLQAYINIGPRLASLIMATVPIIGALVAWIFLGETLSVVQVLGIIVTVAGICVVILEKKNGSEGKHNRKAYAIGLLFSFGGAVGQAVGLIFAKKGLVGDYPVYSAVVIRMLAAFVISLLAGFVFHEMKATIAGLYNRRAMKFTVMGAIVGPYIGIWFSMIAVQSAFVGVASTLMALSPVFLLVVDHFLLHKKVSLQAVIGTLITMSGVVILFIFA